MRPTLTAVAVIAIFVIASGSPALAPHGLVERPAQMAAWAVLGSLAALYRPRGGDAPGLGCLILVPAAVHLGAVPAALLAAVVTVLARILRRLLDHRAAREESGSAPGVWLGAAIAAVATLPAVATAGAWTLESEAAAWAWRWALAGGVVYVAVSVLLLVVLSAPRSVPGQLGHLGIGAVGWGLGALLEAAARQAGWGLLWPLAATLALLAAEAARNAALRGASDQRAGNLQRLHKAHQRILSGTSGMASVAQQILLECNHVMHARWAQFELLHDPAGTVPRSWTIEPDGTFYEGVPRPAARPEALPGIHRRVSWRVLEIPLAAEDPTLAVVRLWCDPRQIEPEAEALLTNLVPQMASSVDRALLDREARYDALTEVPVRRILEARLLEAHHRACEEGTPIAVIMCDVDHFKRVNDSWGHAAGDAALAAVAQALEQERRERDLLARYGGEEFTLLLEETRGDAALQLAERLRKAVENLTFEFESQQIPLTLSAGVAAFPELHVKTPGELLLLADEALYAAKRGGRNRCLLHLGRGSFRAVSGDVQRESEPPRTAIAPRIFG